jgi:hypothetical protein
MARHTAFSSSTMATSLPSFTVPHSLIQGLGSHALTDLLLDFGLMAIRPKGRMSLAFKLIYGKRFSQSDLRT